MPSYLPVITTPPGFARLRPGAIRVAEPVSTAAMFVTKDYGNRERVYRGDIDLKGSYSAARRAAMRLMPQRERERERERERAVVGRIVPRDPMRRAA